MEKLAKTTNRKQLEKELARSRRQYLSTRTAYYDSLQELQELKERVEKLEADMNNHQQEVLELNRQMQVMDLTGAEAIRNRGDDTNFMIDGKECYVNDSNLPDIEIIPWKEYKRKKKEEAEANDQAMASDGADGVSFDSGFADDFSLEDLINDSPIQADAQAESDKPLEFDSTLNHIKELKANDPLAYLTTVAVMKDMASGFSTIERETQYSNWKDRDFRDLLSELNA